MIRWRLGIWGGLVAVGLAGCAAASVPWRHPDLPADQWGRDYSACRRLAEREAGWRDDPSPSSPFYEYDRSQAKRRADGALASCMTERGYVPVSQGEPNRR